MEITIPYNRKTVIDARKVDDKSKMRIRIRAYTLLFVDGLSAEEVAACLGVSAGVVYKWLRKAKIERTQA